MNKLPLAVTLAAVLTLGGLTACHDDEVKPIDVKPVETTTSPVPVPSLSVSASPSKSVSVKPSVSVSVQPDENTNDVPGDGGR